MIRTTANLKPGQKVIVRGKNGKQQAVVEVHGDTAVVVEGHVRAYRRPDEDVYLVLDR